MRVSGKKTIVLILVKNVQHCKKRIITLDKQVFRMID